MNIVQAITERRKRASRIAKPSSSLAFALSKDALGFIDPMGRLLGVNDDEKSATFVVSTSTQDRDGDVVEPGGFMLDNYRRNPVWLFGHGEEPWGVPIGTAESPGGQLAVEVFPDHVKATCWFDQADPDAMYIYGKVARGLLRTTSIGFKPIEGHRIVDDKPGWLFNAIDLLEISIVATPANAEALILGKGMSGRLRKCVGGMCNGFSLPSRIARAQSKIAVVTTFKGGIMPTVKNKKPARVKTTLRKEDSQAASTNNTPASTPDANQVASDVQAVLVPKTKYPDQATAAKWVTDHGYTAETVEDTGESWGFVQFPAEQCTPESAKQTELEDGVLVVVCQGQTETEGGADGAPPAATQADVKALRTELAAIKRLLAKATQADKPCGCGGKTKVAKVNKEESVLDLEDDMEDDQMEDDESDNDGKPHSYGALKALIDHCAEHEPKLEQPKVKAFYGKTLATAKQLLKDVHGEGDGSADESVDSDEAGDDAEDMSEDEEKALVATIEKMQAATDKRMKEMRSLTGRV